MLNENIFEILIIPCNDEVRLELSCMQSEELDCCLVDSLFSMSDKFGDEFSNAKTRVFMVSCTPPDAYENQRKECKERIFTGPQKSQPFKGIYSAPVPPKRCFL